MSIADSNYVVDLIDKFRARGDDEDRWLLANELISDLGGAALNIGLIDVKTAVPVWVRSSMSEMWLEAYVDDGHYRVDPFLHHMKHSSGMIETSGGVLNWRPDATEGEMALSRGLNDAGYSYLAGLPFSGEQSGRKRILTFCSDENPSEFEGVEFRERLNCVATVITAFMGHANDEGGGDPDIMRFRSDVLSARETQALRLLAHGYKNSVIAWQMGVAEITVRKHLHSVRKKLGARTREHAVAIAVHRGLICL